MTPLSKCFEGDLWRRRLWDVNVVLARVREPEGLNPAL